MDYSAGETPDETAPKGDKSADKSDGQIMAMLRSERESAVGFGYQNSDELSTQRQRALNYFKGDMRDVPAAANRSKATDSTVADTIETLLPDLMEIFTEEDTVTFEPQGDEDIEAAKQETDYLRHVIFAQNSGWLEMYTAFKDALTIKLGVWKFWWEESEEIEAEHEGLSQEETALLPDAAEIYAPSSAQGTDTVDAKVTRKTGMAKFMAIEPQDFAAADDTIRIKDTVYCVHRTEPRVQELLDQGYDYDKVMRLSRGETLDEESDYARDTVRETQDFQSDTSNELRRAVIHEHYIRTDLDGDGIKIWRVVTNSNESIILKKEEMDCIPFATITPFPNPHRLIGLSIADKTMEAQRTKTNLKRMLLDSGYFALNQRVEVSEEGSNEFTQGDLLRNEPGMFVRTARAGAIRPLQAGQLGFDVHSALEYEATQAEQRSGVIRNAQGLNPDALHDTASGQASILTMSQKRTRMIARVFAETGFKDLCLGLHKLIRDHAPSALKTRLRGQSVEIDPSEWGSRNDMTIQIGAGGRQEMLAAHQQLAGIISQVVEGQSIANGPIVDTDSIYQAAVQMAETLPLKGTDLIFKNPAQQPPQPPQSDPEQLRMQAEQQAKQQEMQMKAQAQQAEFKMKSDAKQMEFNMKGQEVQLTNQLMREEAAAKIQMMREDAALKAELARDKAAFEAELANRKFEQETRMAQAQLLQQTALAERRASEQINIKKNRPGGDLNK